ncbi:MAG TPA: ribose-phosphate pyrophosphokinase [Alphaproteobacteria bacterium]|nr:ribose-phosphate pyrophosphokinase [Alphaproteobacteria bacterium]
MTPLVFDFPYPSSLGVHIRDEIGADEGIVTVQPFPDGESFLRVESSVEGRNVIINASLFQPNDWFLNLLFLADALKTQGAKRVGLLAPYLAYMRQDKVFHPGEALTSKTFAHLLSTYFDYLITVDPHLHRYHSLSEIYSIPTMVVHAAPLISQWIHSHVKNPFLIGPDIESAQWVAMVAGTSPFIVLDKVRFKDGHVEITWPPLDDMAGKTPIFVDDIISSGGTMLQAVEQLKELSAKPPICVVIHPIFAENSYQRLHEAGVENIVSCNSIQHPSNAIDLTPLLVAALKHF